MIFEAPDWWRLASLFDGIVVDQDGTRAPYAGYKPHVAEAPNGDTRDERCKECGGSGSCGSQLHHLGTWICGTCNGTGFVSVPNVAPPTTRYLHVAPKYNPPPWATAYLARAHYEACRVAEALGVPSAYYPRVADGTLRVLDYDVGGSQPEHTDMDLFTIVCYRSTPLDLELTSGHMSPNWRRNPDGTEREGLDDARAIDPLVHIGEIGELVGLGPATPHRVPARPYRQQSIVYFAMPDHAARLPNTTPHTWGVIAGRGEYETMNGCRVCGVHQMPGFEGGTCGVGPTVSEWLKKRKAASRVYK